MKTILAAFLTLAFPGPAAPVEVSDRPRLGYSSYRGGSGDDSALVVTGPGGSIYLAGTTTSADLPLKSPLMRHSGRADLWITKLGPGGRRVRYSTYLGGRGLDSLDDVAVDAAGNLLLAGSTNSRDFPGGDELRGSKDAFVVKLDASGEIVFSTLLGGSGGDHATAVDTDAAGAVYLHGYTFSSDFPTTEGALKRSSSGEDQDATVVKLTATGEVVYSTLLGGDEGAELGYDVLVTPDGSAYVSGWTDSPDFPTVAAAQAEPGDSYDAYVARLDPTGSRLDLSSYLGGRDLEGGGFLAERPGGGVAVALETFSSDLPATGFQKRSARGKGEVYLALFEPDGGPLAATSYLGGSGGDHVQALDAGADGSLYVAGATGSSDFPVKRAFQRGFGGRSDDDQYLADAFAAKVSPDLSRLVYASYLGGSRDEGASAIDAHDGTVWLSGLTYSQDLPTVRPRDASWNGASDAWFARIVEAPAGTDA